MKTNSQKVYIALSGGVDSSVAAALLQEQGYDCTGVHMRLFNAPSVRENIKSAKTVCKKLNIPLKIFDFRKQFKQKVIDYLVTEFKAGRTPNPCVICNREIKYGLFFDRAMKEGADYIATGHYAQKTQMSNVKCQMLLRSTDPARDQTYFMHRISQKQLTKSLFPIGKYSKYQVRKLAKKFGLPTFERSSSQEVCFMKGKTINEFLQKYFKAKEGSIITKDGSIVGRHDGYWNFTIGQRSGLGLSGGPYYVSKIDAKKNIIIVTKDEEDLYKKQIEIEKPHFISGMIPDLPVKCEVSIRYGHKAQCATLDKVGIDYLIKFEKPVRAPTPGQSAVFYKDGECLGGGTIK